MIRTFPTETPKCSGREIFTIAKKHEHDFIALMNHCALKKYLRSSLTVLQSDPYGCHMFRASQLGKIINLLHMIQTIAPDSAVKRRPHRMLTIIQE